MWLGKLIVVKDKLLNEQERVERQVTQRKEQ